MPEPFRIGFVVFPKVMQLDFTGPLEVFAQIPGAEIHLVWKSRDPIHATSGLTMLPSTTFAECPQLDLVCVPGGPGINALLTDPETLAFLRRQAEGSRYVTSVCTGALVLGAAGVLQGKRAATHWMSMDMLEAFGAIPVNERVVVDGNIITGGGVTAGIDFALRVAAEVADEAVARTIQLAIEYDPRPPFDSGHPRNADPKTIETAKSRYAASQSERRGQVEKAAAALRR
jgi:cyclohexyl-isocyanide hydratase